jgi:hypothetical protein
MLEFVDGTFPPSKKVTLSYGDMAGQRYFSVLTLKLRYERPVHEDSYEYFDVEIGGDRG